MNPTSNLLACISLLIIILLWSFGSVFVTDFSNHSISNNTSLELLSDIDDQFEKVLKPRKFNFPQDHGAHENYRTEWWYFTGNLQTQSGRKFGYQLTFFRYGLSRKKVASTSAWRSNQMYMGHLALTDVENNRFYTEEKFSRAANGLAGSKTNKFKVWLYGWSAEMQDAEDSAIHLTAKADQFAINLLLAPQKPLVLQGQNGFSRKSNNPGNASYYYSYTRLETNGTIRVADQLFTVSGTSWMDREWSTSSLSPEQIGWDWFALQFSDNSELMYYQFRRKDGHSDKNNSGALFLADNSKISLGPSDITIKILDQWKSPYSDTSYPSLWLLSIPSLQLEITLKPLINNQELNLSYRYWEGAVAIRGIKNGNPVTGQGFVELTGYRN